MSTNQLCAMSSCIEDMIFGQKDVVSVSMELLVCMVGVSVNRSCKGIIGSLGN